MSSRLPYFRVFAADELYQLAGLPLNARGLYVTLCCLQWMRGSLPGDEVALARVARVPMGQFRAAWPHIAEYFPVIGPGDARAHPGLGEQQDVASAKSESAKAAARARWENYRRPADAPPKSLEGNGRDPADALRPQSGGNAKQFDAVLSSAVHRHAEQPYPQLRPPMSRTTPDTQEPPGFVEPTPEEREDLERRKAEGKARLLAARDARLAAESAGEREPASASEAGA